MTPFNVGDRVLVASQIVGRDPHPGRVKALSPTAVEVEFEADRSALWCEPGEVRHRYTIEFSEHLGRSTPRLPLADFTDDAIDATRAAYERLNGPLPRDSRTAYPSFTLYEDGEELGGG